jgi:flagellar biosynthetic protein FliS
MHPIRSPHEAYRKVDFDARVAGADPRQLVMLCYEQLGSALGSAIHAAASEDNARKSASLTRALSAITALQMGLDHTQPVALALNSMFESARRTVLDCVIEFDARSLDRLKADFSELASAFRQVG